MLIRTPVSSQSPPSIWPGPREEKTERQTEEICQLQRVITPKARRGREKEAGSDSGREAAVIKPEPPSLLASFNT